MFEHYTSLLDNDPNKRTQAELVQQTQLRFKMEDENRQARDAIARALKVGGATNGNLLQQIQVLQANVAYIASYLGLQLYANPPT